MKESAQLALSWLRSRSTEVSFFFLHHVAWLFEQVTYHCGLKLINDDSCDYYAHPVLGIIIP